MHDGIHSLNESTLLISVSVGAFTFAGVFLVTHDGRELPNKAYTLICVDLLGIKVAALSEGKCDLRF